MAKIVFVLFLCLAAFTGPYIDPRGSDLRIATGPYIDPDGADLRFAAGPMIDPQGGEAWLA